MHTRIDSSGFEKLKLSGAVKGNPCCFEEGGITKDGNGSS